MHRIAQKMGPIILPFLKNLTVVLNVEVPALEDVLRGDASNHQDHSLKVSSFQPRRNLLGNFFNERFHTLLLAHEQRHSILLHATELIGRINATLEQNAVHWASQNWQANVRPICSKSQGHMQVCRNKMKPTSSDTRTRRILKPYKANDTSGCRARTSVFLRRASKIK